MIDANPLLVFADDWGVHPSSCQHLVRRFLTTNRVVWFHTVGLRLPRPTPRDARKILEKMRVWSGLGPRIASRSQARVAPEIRDVPLFPLTVGRTARRCNDLLLRRAVRSFCAPANADGRPVILSTLPLTADLAGAFPRALFVYYAVDDYGSWPGLGSALVREMDEEQARRADLVLAASNALAESLRSRSGRAVEYLPHGVDAEHFALAKRIRERLLARESTLLADAVFFGALDERIDVELFAAVARARPRLRFLVLGPWDPRGLPLAANRNVLVLGQVPYDDLPLYLAQASVAILPYVGGPFGKRIAPLKAREALAAGLPVVGTPVPELASLGEGVSLASTPEGFAGAIDRALAQGAPAATRVAHDSWEARARRLAERVAEAWSRREEVAVS